MIRLVEGDDIVSLSVIGGTTSINGMATAITLLKLMAFLIFVILFVSEYMMLQLLVISFLVIVMEGNEVFN